MRSHSRFAPGGILIAVVVALVLVQALVFGIISINSDAQRHTLASIRGARALYAADAGAHMALAEVYAHVDRDGDGMIGSISNDAKAANNPSVNGIAFVVAPAASTYGTKFRVSTQAADVYRQLELLLESAESFENYAITSPLSNIGGWAPWDNNPAANAYPSTSFARTGAQSIDITQTSDAVRSLSITSGTWTITAYQYIPSSTTGSDHYFILLNTYNPGGTKFWSTQVRFRLTNNTVSDNLPGGRGTVTSRTLVRNQWVPIVVTIDLEMNRQTVTYNGQAVLTAPWVRFGGTSALAAINLYGSSASHVYYDDIQVVRSGSTAPITITSWKQVAPTP